MSFNTTQNAGYLMFIGKRLWQDIGRPERVALSRWGKTYKIKVASADEDSYAIMASQQAIPRIAVGSSAMGDLKLHEGRFAGTVKEQCIVFHAE